MNFKKIITNITLVSLIFVFTFAMAGQAQWKPEKEVLIINPYDVGGGTDVLSRILKPFIEEIIGQTVVVEAVPGAGGIIGTTRVYNMPADGYTLMCTAPPGYHLRAASDDSIYNTEDFLALAKFSSDPYVIYVPGNSPWNNINELIDDVKGNPNKYSVTSGGPLHTGALGMVMVQEGFGLEWKYVPYDGNSPVIAGILGGHFDIAVGPGVRYMDYVKENQIKILASLADRRIEGMPGIPTLKEETGKDIYDSSERGFVIHAAAPEEIVNYWREVFKKVAENPEVQELIEKQMPFEFSPGTEYQKMFDLLSESVVKYLPILESINP